VNTIREERQHVEAERDGVGEKRRVGAASLAASPPELAPLMDMNMLDMTGGKKRQIAEFDALFTTAGLRRVKVSSA